MNIIAVDWGKSAAKRAAYRADLAARTISRLETAGSLAHLVECASGLEPPVLIGIDAAIGFPERAWNRLQAGTTRQWSSFADYLLNGPLPARFFEPVAHPGEWSPEQPFIRPPKGRWSLTAFADAAERGLYREIDSRLNGNPIFVTSGIPGSVGSGTRALWQELIEVHRSSSLSVWPFHGPLTGLLKAGKPTIAEIYPKACYGIALAESLPAPLTSIAKTRESARLKAIAHLRETDWLIREGVTLGDLDAAIAGEDDFDALFSAAALLRLVLEEAPLESPGVEDPVAEGGVLGAASVTTDFRGRDR